MKAVRYNMKCGYCGYLMHRLNSVEKMTCPMCNSHVHLLGRYADVWDEIQSINSW